MLRSRSVFSLHSSFDSLLLLNFKVYHIEFQERRRLLFANICISSGDNFKFENCVKYAKKWADDAIHSTQYN